jgi:rare lipoprotein A
MKYFVIAAASLFLTTTTASATVQSGIASYYWQPQPVACGGRFNPSAITAAHKTLPCGSRVEVQGQNGRTVTVTINDRGPFVRGRIIDLSLAAAKRLGMTGAGLMKVTIRRVK